MIINLYWGEQKEVQALAKSGVLPCEPVTALVCSDRLRSLHPSTALQPLGGTARERLPTSHPSFFPFHVAQAWGKQPRSSFVH